MAPASAFASAWSKQAGGVGEIRLISAGRSKGLYEAAVEIKLAPTAVTYWRQPGEAGVPPQFSFAGSENVASAKVLYPAPSRLDEGGIEAFGYRGGVTFPIRVTPRDATKPARLDLSLDYAVCDRICIPAKGHAELVLPQSGDSPERALIAAAEARVPAILPSTSADKVAIHALPTDKAKPRWSLVWKGTMPASDLFVEGPDGWAFETHKTAHNTFALTAVETPTPVPEHVSVRLTLTGPDKAYELTAPLVVAKAEK
ncbi:MAG: protein-disulfide reductase DsbD domain-containing protein [Methylovirgula sp.]